MDDAEKKMNEELAKIAEATIPRRYDDKKKKQLAVSVFLYHRHWSPACFPLHLELAEWAICAG